MHIIEVKEFQVSNYTLVHIRPNHDTFEPSLSTGIPAGDNPLKASILP